MDVYKKSQVYNERTKDMSDMKVEVQKAQYTYIMNEYQDILILSESAEEKTILARKISNGRLVTKKIMPRAQGTIYERLMQQRHPNIVPVMAVAYYGEQCIVILEYISGMTLRELLQERESLPEHVAVSIVLQLLQGIEFIQRLGIIHRDIHPGNILISSDNVVKLIDFGIARSRKENQSTDTSILGTVGFAAPEQFGFAQTDVRTDIYSVGVLFNVMLTGKFPTVVMASGKSGETIRKAIQISPNERFQNVEEMRRAINNVSSSKTEETNINYFKPPGFRTGKRWKKVIALFGYFWMILFTVVLFFDAIAKASFLGGILEIIAMLLVFWLPLLVAANWGNWSRKLWPFSKWDSDVMIVIRVIVPVILVYAGMELDTFIRAM